MKNKIISIFVCLMHVFIFHSFSQSFKEVKIGKQVWMTENLNVDQFSNGDLIPEAKTAEEWNRAGENHQPAWCYYENDSTNGKKYGKLYNWYAVNDPRGLAPKGWHVPTDAEWKLLAIYLGGEEIAGKKMKSQIGWHENGNGTNESDFNARAGGYRRNDGFYNHLKNGVWWSSKEKDSNKSILFGLHYRHDDCGIDEEYKRNGMSVRCIKD